MFKPSSFGTNRKVANVGKIHRACIVLHFYSQHKWRVNVMHLKEQFRRIHVGNKMQKDFMVFASFPELFGIM